MITLSTLAGQPVNDFPSLRAAAFFCEDMTDDELWELSFLDVAKMKLISWITVRVEIEKIQRLTKR